MSKNVQIVMASALLLIILLVAWAIKVPSGEQLEAAGSLSGIIYFFGEECPHCQDVAKFLEENKVADKVTFEKKEVWHDKENKKEFDQALRECNIPSKEAGVPFVYDGGKCYMGGPEVIKFFKNKAEIQ